MKTLALLLLFLSHFALANTNEEKLRNIHSLKRIAFGSCNQQSAKQPLWEDILKQNPDLWIWGGDIIYADWEKDSLENSYKKQNANPDYIKLKSKIPIIGIWDDHDYGLDNANGSARFKKDSQRFLLDFLEVPLDSPRRSQEGIYTSYVFGEVGQRVKIILLDNRYFKDLEESSPLLGEMQWLWLEDEFINSTADLHIIVSGLSIFSPLMYYTEEWGEHPNEVNRLLGLLKKYQVKAPLFLTGDKHFSSIFKRSGQLEFLSSGLTHTAPKKAWYFIRRRYPVSYLGLSYGQVDITWEKGGPVLVMSIRNAAGRDIFPTKVKWVGHEWIFIN